MENKVVETKLVFTGEESVIEKIVDRCFAKHFPNAPTQVPLVENKILHSIKELAEVLKCSPGTAQKLKNSGVIPFTQYGRKIQFDTAAVLSALEKDKAKPRKRK